MNRSISSSKILIAAGVLFFGYALLGNYIALPGYIRFLERGGVSEAGNTLDLDVFIGATKTVLWMYSFQAGALCFALAHSIRERLATNYLMAGAMLWLALWSWPNLPAPPPAFYVVLGTVLLISIGMILVRGMHVPDVRLRRSLLLGAALFFAFATWEVCGLGTTGRILHPEEAASPMAHSLVVTQSSKLMLEFVLAWLLLSAALAGPAAEVGVEKPEPL